MTMWQLYRLTTPLSVAIQWVDIPSYTFPPQQSSAGVAVCMVESLLSGLGNCMPWGGTFSPHGVEIASWTQVTARLYSYGVLAGSILRRVDPVHPEGVHGSDSGLPCPSWWPVSGQIAPDYTFPPETEASVQRAYAMWWIRMIFHSLESSALPSLGDQDSLLRSWFST